MIYVLTVQALQGGKRWDGGMRGDGTHDIRANCAAHCAGTAGREERGGSGMGHMIYVLTVQALQGGKRGDGTHDIRANCAAHCAGTAGREERGGRGWDT